MRKILFALTMLGLVSCDVTNDNAGHEPSKDSSKVKRVVRFLDNNNVGPKIVRYVDTSINVGDTTLLANYTYVVVK